MENGLKCGTFGASAIEDRHLATGDHKGKLAIYDLENIATPTYTAQAHSSIINCIDGVGGMEIGYGAPEIVTGGRDGCVRLWDPRVPNPVLALEVAIFMPRKTYFHVLSSCPCYWSIPSAARRRPSSTGLLGRELRQQLQRRGALRVCGLRQRRHQTLRPACQRHPVSHSILETPYS